MAYNTLGAILGSYRHIKSRGRGFYDDGSVATSITNVITIELDEGYQSVHLGKQIEQTLDRLDYE